MSVLNEYTDRQTLRIVHKRLCSIEIKYDSCLLVKIAVSIIFNIIWKKIHGYLSTEIFKTGYWWVFGILFRKHKYEKEFKLRTSTTTERHVSTWCDHQEVPKKLPYILACCEEKIATFLFPCDKGVLTLWRILSSIKTSLQGITNIFNDT